MERRLTIDVLELTIARVRCGKQYCRGVLEVPVEQLGQVAAKGSVCPSCGERFLPDLSGANPLTAYADALLGLQKWHDRVRVEFSLPMPPGSP